MKPPTDPADKPSSYWIRGPRTRLHGYYQPSDSRAGVMLMLLIAVLGLIAIGVGILHLSRSPVPRRDDLILTGAGIIAAAIGLYQALRLRNRS